MLSDPALFSASNCIIKVYCLFVVVPSSLRIMVQADSSWVGLNSRNLYPGETGKKIIQLMEYISEGPLTENWQNEITSSKLMKKINKWMNY